MLDLEHALAGVPGLTVKRNAPLRRYTRFGIGGPADLLVDAGEPETFRAALVSVRASGFPYVVIGGGTNLVVADSGYRGAVLRFTGSRISRSGSRITADAGAELQALVDFSVEQGLAGLHTMTGIPGWVGAAVYGNAGAYGHSMHEFVRRVEVFDGTETRELENSGCLFAYRESIFKRNKQWVILAADLELPSGDPELLAAKAGEIRSVRDAKYPRTMKCAGSIFKNLLYATLPESVQRQIPDTVVREGKVPSAWFLEQAGAKGQRRGDIQVATYHANLIYNDGEGTAADLRTVIEGLKESVAQRFGFVLEEEVQYIGFE